MKSIFSIIIASILITGCSSVVTTPASYTQNNIDKQASIMLSATAVNIVNDTRHNRNREQDSAMLNQAFVKEFAKYENKFQSKNNLTISNVKVYFSPKLSFGQYFWTALASFFIPPLAAVHSRETFPLKVEYEALQASGEKWSSNKLTSDISGYYTGWYVGRANSGFALIAKEIEFAGQESARMILNDIYAKLLPATEISNPKVTNLLQRPKEPLPSNSAITVNSINPAVNIATQKNPKKPLSIEEPLKSPISRLQTAKDLYDQGLINKEDFEEKKRSIMKEL